MDLIKEYIDLNQTSLYISLASIIFNPLFWNIVARQEHKNKVLTKLAGGNPYLGCYGLAVTIFGLGILRDHLYQKALADQPKLPLLDEPAFKALAAILFGIGGVLVLSSMWVLGVTGTYLGDYFGILMDHKVESFPFDVTDNPMYIGSTFSFLGTALWFQSPAGIVLTLIVYIEYKIALLFEEPFTGAIYAAREAARAKGVTPAEKSTGKSSAVKARKEL